MSVESLSHVWKYHMMEEDNGLLELFQIARGTMRFLDQGLDPTLAGRLPKFHISQ